MLHLRKMIDSDLDVLFEYERDPEAVNMAAFTAKDPNDRIAYDKHWEKIRNTESVIIRTIIDDDTVVGSIIKWENQDKSEVSYWVGKEFWGRGIATWALLQMIDMLAARPLFARVAKDNVGSIRVLTKCGFVIAGLERGFANARAEEIDEYLMTLE